MPPKCRSMARNSRERGRSTLAARIPVPDRGRLGETTWLELGIVAYRGTALHASLAPGSFERGPNGGGRFPAGEEPSGEGGDQGHTEGDDGEVGDGDVGEIAQVVDVGPDHDEVRTGDPEQCPESGERPGGCRGEVAADRAGGSGGSEGAEVARGFAADEPHGHG